MCSKMDGRPSLFEHGKDVLKSHTHIPVLILVVWLDSRSPVSERRRLLANRIDCEALCYAKIRQQDFDIKN
jgi:hypothetical protein